MVGQVATLCTVLRSTMQGSTKDSDRTAAEDNMYNANTFIMVSTGVNLFCATYIVGVRDHIKLANLESLTR